MPSRRSPPAASAVGGAGAAARRTPTTAGRPGRGDLGQGFDPARSQAAAPPGGRDAGRRRSPIVSEAEFLARRESVDRVMVVRGYEDRTQIAVLEDKILVEHYVTRDRNASMIGNVYLGKVQNVLPSMEAAFIDIGRGRNAVLYAGEVNWEVRASRVSPNASNWHCSPAIACSCRSRRIRWGTKAPA